ncbi:ABC transporter permease [Fibrella forsythiae]|uniref:ABC transporter permease n=1 Tax=Fibrella forsythiae TaxID=2817061 RepID=A0ABS3JE13_9BACT|nr:ABC transporter permease [Fibrella forsythiae]MBO0948232.1 ABC transporter permease [Fibrella forsythiae]
MLKNYFKIAWRNIVNNKVYSFINIGGLAVGMAVAMLIGLWMWDELSFNKGFANYDRIAQVMQHQTFNGEVGTQGALPFPIGAELRKSYGSDFRYVVMGTWINGHILSAGDNKFSKNGAYMEPQASELLTLTMKKGTRSGLTDPNSIMLSESAATAYFGATDPIGKVMRIDNKFDVKVTGVYTDLPFNSSFKELNFIAPWDLYFNDENWPEKITNPWRANMYVAYAQVADNVDMEQLSAKIRDVKLRNVHKEEAVFKPAVFLHPMRKWHLYSGWKNGVNTGGRIDYVWLFGIISVFVLLLACINFMNLSTARSEKRAREVGIRKAVGSMRGQLINQFFSESLLVVAIAFVLSVLLVQLMLPAFNQIADKQLSILWASPLFWLCGLGFSLLTGGVAGSYPAFYLSSFQPIKVLKGTFRVGRFAALPRKVLVVVQFTVSVTLIIGTLIVFRQIQYAKNRPLGYNQNGLITVPTTTGELAGHYEAVRAELLATGTVAEASQSSSPTTGVWVINNGYEWPGKDASVQGNFGTIAVSHDFGKTVGWQFKAGRDFSRQFATDTLGMVLNAAAATFMGLKDPVGTVVKADGKPYKVIGVINDMVMDSPYNPAMRTVFMLDYTWANLFTIRIAPSASPSVALPKIEAVFRKYAPSAPFNYRFVDQEYNQKFGDEERIGKLATVFAMLAIFISCLGLFGLASFVAEQRTKEIGVRKVLGATVLNLWGLLSKDFLLLVFVAFAIATPIAHYSLSRWLLKYDYHTDISWWIFVASGAGALAITLLTVSYQSIKAALMNPVKSLRAE